MTRLILKGIWILFLLLFVYHLVYQIAVTDF